MFDKTGISVNKKQLRDTLVALASDTSRKLTAYAKFANNQVLLNETKFTDSDLKRAADTLLRDMTQGIYDRAQTNIAALATYGVTAATQTALQNAITAFVTSIPKPRLGITDKKQSTAQLANYFDVADAALDNIDIIVELVKVTQANFYNGYKTARKIIETGTGSLILKLKVSDAQTGDPLANATLAVTPENGLQKAASHTTKESIVKKTAAGGGLNVKSLEDGNYIVTASKPGYKDKQATVSVVNGEMAVLEIELEKV
jgi:hypothetical protein